MRNFLIAFCFISAQISIAQIKVAEEYPSTRIGRVGFLLTTYVTLDKSGDGTYTFNYQNQHKAFAADYRSFSFRDVNNDFENLYKMVIDGFENPPKEDIKLELPNDYIWLRFSKGKHTQLQFRHMPKNSPDMRSTIPITKKEAMKLFGKNEGQS